MILGHPFDSPEAREINRNIFETMYHASLEESCNLARENQPYKTFQGSPASQGILQFDMWDNPGGLESVFSGMWNWNQLKSKIKKYGLMNSLLMAPMPTASTSQILGNNECIEPYTNNIYLRRTLAGEFVVVNKHLVKHLQENNMWSREIKNKIIADRGSVQNLEGLSNEAKGIFKTVWEISQKSIIDMASDRGRFIDQSQSMNLFIEQPTMSKLSSMHMYAWKSGLKTGIYYLRTKPKSSAIQVTIDPNQCTTCSA